MQTFLNNRLLFITLLVMSLLPFAPAMVKAREVRVALLIANERGWKGDPHLQYALTGDLRPLAQMLRRVGFQVQTLENTDAATVRKEMKRILGQLKRGTKIDTFLFYYSGHADRSYLHLGARGKAPISYRELAVFFQHLALPRRIAIIDACYSGEAIRQFGSLSHYQSLLRAGNPKGVRASRALDLRKLLLPERGNESGIRIISSSLTMAWELRRYRASVFTYHLLAGLRGASDLNQDGRITVDELFDYASREVKQDTGQRPQQMVMLKRETPYALAPAYGSRLRIGSQITGQLKIAVANFLWSINKQRAQEIHLAVVHGQGTVFLQKDLHCWRQQILLPKGGEARLPNRWQKVPCHFSARVPKGSVLLQAMPLERPVTVSDLSLAVGGGFAQLGDEPLRASHLSWGLLLRWRFLGLGLQYMLAPPSDKSFWLSRLLLHAEVGWPVSFDFLSFRWQFFLGGYFHAGTTLQHKSQLPTSAVASLGVGATTDLSWWWSYRVGLRLSTQLGADYTPILDRSGFSLHWQTQLFLILSL